MDKRIAFFFALPIRTAPALITMPFGLNVIKLLDKKGYKIDVYLSEYRNNTYQDTFSKNVKFHFIDQNILWRNNVLLAYFLITNYLKLKSLISLRNKYDLIFGSGMAGITLGSILKKYNKKAKLIYLNDEFPIQGEKNIWTFKEIKHAKNADIVSTPDEFRFEALCKQIPNISDKPHFTLPNTPLISELKNLPKINWHNYFNIPEEKKIFIMAGGISEHNYINEIIESTNLWPENTILLLKGKKNESIKINSNNKSKIVFSDEILEPAKLHSLIKYCDASICLYKEINENFKFVGKSSGKLMRSIALGKPVITNNNTSFSFIKELNIGVTINQPEEISSAIKFIIENKTLLEKNCSEKYHAICYESYWEKFEKHLFKN